MSVEPRAGWISFAGHDLRYRVAGRGPALVLVKPHRHPADYPQLRSMAGRYRVIQIDPLGFGASDRPGDHPWGGIHSQVFAVVEREVVDRFAVWGYSQGGAMAAAVARAGQRRVVAMIAGGFSLATQPTDAWMARTEREQRVPDAARIFWRHFKQFNWAEELAEMTCSRLLYVGGDDRVHVAGIRRTRAALERGGTTLAEFDGLDHQTCNREPALSAHVVPTVVDWLDRTVGRKW